jgi:hypothetical protein
MFTNLAETAGLIFLLFLGRFLATAFYPSGCKHYIAHFDKNKLQKSDPPTMIAK